MRTSLILKYFPTEVYGKVKRGYVVSWSAPSCTACARSVITSSAVCPGRANIISALTEANPLLASSASACSATTGG
jgi:hypothetical protein